jgi:hypothetical protein
VAVAVAVVKNVQRSYTYRNVDIEYVSSMATWGTDTGNPFKHPCSYDVSKKSKGLRLAGSRSDNAGEPLTRS